MRDIKLRAYYKKQILPFLNLTGENDYYNSDCLSLVCQYPNEFKVMQYTGLKDKDGKEIYEGDIIVNFYIHYEHNGVNFEVTCNKSEYKNKACSHLQVQYKDSSAAFFGVANSSMYLGQAHMEHWKIIGNIFENPELLK